MFLWGQIGLQGTNLLLSKFSLKYILYLFRKLSLSMAVYCISKTNFIAHFKTDIKIFTFLLAIVQIGPVKYPIF